MDWDKVIRASTNRMFFSLIADIAAAWYNIRIKYFLYFFGMFGGVSVAYSDL